MAPSAKKYRFTRDSFVPLTTKPIHMDMTFDMHQDKVHVTMHATYSYKGKEPMQELKLNSKGLEISGVERMQTFSPLQDSQEFVQHVASLADPIPLEYKVDTDDHFLVVTFNEPIPPQSEFVIKTMSTATPTENILEGLYFDYNPEGCPRTIITQCQQYGFQRIVPCIDTMDAKCFYTTTIVADKHYTNIITNGDLAPTFVDEKGLPVYHPADEILGDKDDTRHALRYYNHKVCMAPYLFFLGVGTYETYRQTLEFVDGDTMLIELLALPGRATDEGAKQAVKMLHDSIQWTMISLGPEACEHHDERKKIYALLEEREALKAQEAPLVWKSTEQIQRQALNPTDADRLAAIRAELKSLLQVWGKTGYKYTGAIYREIGMENSNYGGMENVGNTTIVSSCLCPSCTMVDRSYEYMERVKVHEYYHNINGSQVTGQSPFEIWLNEAVTVHMERKRYASIFGAAYARLKDIKVMFTPAMGPLAQDLSPTSLSIEPEGFNQTQELVSVVTYSKAPEVVRMVELLLGHDKFNKALDLYHTRYSYANATSMEWFQCMEEVGKIDLQNFAKTWLKRSGYPQVSYSATYDAEQHTYTVHMKQTGFENKPQDNNGPWELPIDYAVVKDGQVVKEGVYFWQTAEADLVLDGIADKPDYISFARGWSFFGKSANVSACTEEFRTQALSDPDPINKYFGYRAVAEQEKALVIESLLKQEESHQVSPEYVDLFSTILFDDSINPAVRALTLMESNMTMRDDLSFQYQQVYEAHIALYQAVVAAHGPRILDLYKDLVSTSTPGPHPDQLQLRLLKNFILSILATAMKPKVLSSIEYPCGFDASELATLAVEQLNNSTFTSDQASAFRIVMESPDFHDRDAVHDAIYAKWKDNSNTMQLYLEIISSLNASDLKTRLMTVIEDTSAFNWNLTQHTRTVARGLASIRHYSVATSEGRQVILDLFTRIGKVNQMSAYPLLKAFDEVAKFTPQLQAQCRATLQSMQDGIDKVDQESLYNQLSIMLTQ